MAEWSAFWETTVGGIGDQEVGYTESHWSDVGRILAACAGFEGAAPGYENELDASEPAANTARIAAGGGVVDGKIYDNTTPVDINIPSPGAGTNRIDRIVLRCEWASYTVRLTRIVGAPDPVPAPPAITQNSGATYDITLWQVYITPGGLITFTDERIFAGARADGITLENVGGVLSIADNGVSNAKLRDSAGLSVIGRASDVAGDPADIVAATNHYVLLRSGVTLQFGQVTTGGIADNAITGAKIQNRTRSFFVQPQYGYNDTDGAALTPGFAGRYSLTDDKVCTVSASFSIPQDYVRGVSNMVAYPIISAPGIGVNMRLDSSDVYGLDFIDLTPQTWWQNSVLFQTVAVGGDYVFPVGTVSMNVEAREGMPAYVEFRRAGNHVDDTVNANVTFYGWIVAYVSEA